MKNILILILLAALFASPWPIGGNFPFARTALLLLGAIALAGSIVLHFRGGAEAKERNSGDLELKSPRVPQVFWVFLIGITYTVFQALGAGQLSHEAGAAEGVESTTALVDTFDSAAIPFSVNPAATRKRLVDLVLGVSFFWLGATLLTDRRSITKTLIGITAAGVCLSAFGIVQKLSFSGRIYGVYELLFGGDPFGPFVNGNNAAGYLLIAFAASLFFAAQQLFVWSRKQGHQLDSKQDLIPTDWEDDSKESLLSSFLQGVAVLQSKHLYFLAMLAVVVAGILMTLSRSGIVALVMLVVVVFALIARANWKASLALAATILVAGVSLVLYLDHSTEISGEIESLADVASAGEVRLLHWNDALQFASESSYWGVGGGTYRYVSRLFQTFHYPRVFAHAESVYVETLVEMGVFGLVLVAITFVMLLRYCWLLLRCDSAFDRSLGVAATGCLVGQTTVAFLDFGLYQAPNSITMATMMGMVASRSIRVSPVRSSSTLSQQAPGFASVLGRQLISFVVLAGAVWAIYESCGVESLRLASRKVQYFETIYKRAGVEAPGEEELVAAESLLGIAQAIRPDDSDVYSGLGELKIAQARVLEAKATEKELEQQILELENQIGELEEKQDEADAELVAGSKAYLEQLKAVTKEVIWSTTAPTALHQRLRRSQRSLAERIEDVFPNDEVITRLDEAWHHYRRAEELCPTLTLPPLRLAQLAAFASLKKEGVKGDRGLAEERRYVKIALERTFMDSRTLYNCGFLALNSGDQGQAVQFWSKCLRYPHFSVHERSIVSLCIQELPMKLFFEQVLPQNPHDLIRIAAKYFRDQDLTLPKRFLLTHTATLINSSEELDDLEREILLAESAVLQSDYSVAIEHYQSALELKPQSAPWRLSYARALLEVEDFDEALRQLKICQLDSSLRQNQVQALIAKIRRTR